MIEALSLAIQLSVAPPRPKLHRFKEVIEGEVGYSASFGRSYLSSEGVFCGEVYRQGMSESRLIIYNPGLPFFTIESGAKTRAFAGEFARQCGKEYSKKWTSSTRRAK